MTTPSPNASPKIFISYAWENQVTAKQLQQALQAAGAEVFIDYNSIRGGDILPIHISRGLDWCDTLILLWSEHAKNSHWVELEWTSVLASKKNLIPCKLDEIRLPAVLLGKLYIEFKSFDHGLNELLAALRLKTPAKVISEPEIVLPVELPILQLRSKPIEKLSFEAVKAMLKKYDFYCAKRDWTKIWCNPRGKGIVHNYELQQNDKIVADHATGLSWHQADSQNYVSFADTEKFIRGLNDQNFTGYSDWRLPTLEEGMSLVEAQAFNGLHIDPVFDGNHSWIWTADQYDYPVLWAIDFSNGGCAHDVIGFFSTVGVRAVRTS